MSTPTPHELIRIWEIERLIQTQAKEQDESKEAPMANNSNEEQQRERT